MMTMMTLKKKERVESLMDDEVEDRRDADLDQVLPVLQHPRPHLRPGQTLQLKLSGKGRYENLNIPMKKFLPMTFADLKIWLLFITCYM